VGQQVALGLAVAVALLLRQHLPDLVVVARVTELEDTVPHQLQLTTQTKQTLVHDAKPTQTKIYQIHPIFVIARSYLVQLLLNFFQNQFANKK